MRLLRGQAREGDVPPPAQSAEALAKLESKERKHGFSTA